MDYITSKIHRELNPPDMSEWTLEELEPEPVVKKKRGRPKKVKVPLIEEDFMDTTE
jgi:hypothetical protein